MSNALPVYNFPEVEGTPSQQLGMFESIFETAKVKGVVSATPQSDEETYQVQSQQVRIQTVASRLWLLGYLPEKIHPDEIEKNKAIIREAVIQFQGDANLKKDFWVGNKTWYALDELVSYESHFSPEHWFDGDEIIGNAFVAINRAAHLRLWSLGLIDERPVKEFNPLQLSDLSDFKKILHLFSIKHDPSKMGLNRYSMQLLFDQDTFSIAVARSKYPSRDAFLYNIKAVINSTPEIDDIPKLKELGRKFIVNCARIELWLLGFDVTIGAEVSNRLKRKMTTRKRGNLRKELTKYYLNFEALDTTTSSQMAQRISPKFFKGIAAANVVANGKDVEDISELIAEKVKTKTQINTAWNYIKTKGMRLFDGLKRVWRWIKKIGKKVTDFIKNNIFKAFFRYVSKAYKIAARGINNIVKAFKVYFKGGMVSENSYFEFSKDMDATVFLNHNTTKENMQSAIDKLRKQSKAFNLGCRIVGWLFKIFKELIKGYIGWAKLLFALIKSYKEIRILYQDFKMVATQ